MSADEQGWVPPELKVGTGVPKMVTEAEAVRRERVALAVGVGLGWGCSCHDLPRGVDRDRLKRQWAAQQYPMPKVTRPRVERYGGKEYRLDGGRFLVRSEEAGWWLSLGIPPGVASALLANPTEEVEADE
jgi:hypothetical protein